MLALMVLLVGLETIPVHDCRIAKLNITATRSEAGLTLTAHFLAYDGKELLQKRCPDQNGPTWGTDRPVELLDADGYVVRIHGDAGEVVAVSVATVQRPDKSFYREKRFRF